MASHQCPLMNQPSNTFLPASRHRHQQQVYCVALSSHRLHPALLFPVLSCCVFQLMQCLSSSCSVKVEGIKTCMHRCQAAAGYCLGSSSGSNLKP
jgi:hypothetical protein